MSRKTCLLGAISALILGAGIAAAPAHAHARPLVEKYAHQAFTTTNVNRTSQGLRKVVSDSCLKKAAIKQATLMAGSGEIYHQDLTRLLKRCHLNSVGENVAYGFPTGRSVVDDGWMNSEGHRANILNGSYTRMAIGARQGQDGFWYVSQVFGRSS